MILSGDYYCCVLKKGPKSYKDSAYRHRTRARAKKTHKPTLLMKAEAEATRRDTAPKASKTP